MGVTLSPTCPESGGGLTLPPVLFPQSQEAEPSPFRTGCLCFNAWMLSNGASFTPAEAEKLDKERP